MARARKASEWITWRSRHRLSELGLPGIYFIGKYPTAPSRLDIASPSIIYIGHTILPLKHRLLKFHYSAFDAKDGHYGGSTFNELFSNGRPGLVPRGLRVCVIPVYGKEPARSALIRLLERKYIYKFVQVHGRLPICNKS
jgi:hypothetical protein